MLAAIIQISLAVIIFFILLIFVIDLFLRGFSPFFPSRPWVMKKLVDEINLDTNSSPRVYAFCCGKSGFLHFFKKRFPRSVRIGIEYQFYPWLVAKTQKILRFSSIHILYKELYQIDVKDADLIYCYLNVEEVRELGKKFKFECKPGTIIISNGVAIPHLEIKQAINLDPRPGRLAWLSKSRNFYLPSSKVYNYENRVFIYEIG